MMSITKPTEGLFVFIGDVDRDYNLYPGSEQEQVSPGGGIYFNAVASSNLECKTLLLTTAAPWDQMYFQKEMYEVDTEYIVSSRASTCVHNKYIDKHRISCLTSIADPITVHDMDKIDEAINKRNKPEGAIRSMPHADCIVVNYLYRDDLGLSLFSSLRTRCSVLALDLLGPSRLVTTEKDNINTQLCDWPDKLQCLPLCDLVKCDDDELKLFTGVDDITTGIFILHNWMSSGGQWKITDSWPQEGHTDVHKVVVITSSDQLTVYDGDVLHHAPLIMGPIEARTGRGDTATAAYLYAWRKCKMAVSDAANFAAHITNLKLQKPGPYRRQIHGK